MRIQIFRAASLQAALEEIRHEMGPDASVLKTRQLRDGWMGWLGSSYVEVTAGIKEGSNRRFHPHMDGVKGQESDQPHDETSPKNRLDDLDAATTRLDLHIPLDGSHVSGPTGMSNSRFQSINADRSTQNDLELPAQLVAYRRELRATGVSESIISRWLTSTTSFAANLGEGFAEPWLEHLQRSVAREIRLSGPIRMQPGNRHVVALIGPTGVGKTTTVAKLAAGFRLDAKRRVGLLTIDTFRIAAVEQLRAYAEIMDLPMQVVEQPEQMRPALKRLGDVDLVLIDTAGRSPKSDTRIEQLVELLRVAEVDETHLVLSATSTASAIGSVLKSFSAAQPTSAILTKLDETPYTAAALSAITASATRPGMPLSYITHGQQVPEDIAIADAISLVSRLLPETIAMPDVGAA